MGDVFSLIKVSICDLFPPWRGRGHLLFEPTEVMKIAHMDVDGKIVNITLKELNVLLNGQAITVWNIFGEREFYLVCGELEQKQKK